MMLKIAMIKVTVNNGMTNVLSSHLNAGINSDIASNEKITACLLSLASNVQTQSLLNPYLTSLPEQLSQYLPLDKIWFSEVMLSPDIQDLGCPIYHNQMALLIFSKPMLYANLHDISKQLETLAHRRNFAKPMVTLDVDIIAVEVQKTTISSPIKNWTAITRRLPLASYEKQCLTDLWEKMPLSNSERANMILAKNQQFFKWLLNVDMV